METDDVRVVEALMDGDFRGHLLPLVLLQDQRLRDDFSGKNLLGVHICDFVALRKATFPQKPSSCVSFHGAGVHQNIWDFLQRSRFGIDERRVRRLRNTCTHFGFKSAACLKETLKLYGSRGLDSKSTDVNVAVEAG